MPQERLSLEKRHPPTWPPAYERSPWLDARNKAIQVEGDPQTAEAFAAAYDFLHVATVYFKTEHGTDRSPTRKGLWWIVSAEDVEEELNQRNQWATWAKKQRRQTEDASALTEVSLAQVLALSYRRLQALHQVSGPEHLDYPVFLHVHEQIREARCMQAQIEQVLPVNAKEPLPPLSPFLTTPAWKRVGEVQEQQEPVTQTNTVVYGNPELARYGFTVIDPYHHPLSPLIHWERQNHTPLRARRRRWLFIMNISIKAILLGLLMISKRIPFYLPGWSLRYRPKPNLVDTSRHRPTNGGFSSAHSA
jgi:hypothetical protein